MGFLRTSYAEKHTVITHLTRQYLPHYVSDKGFKSTLVNRTLLSLHGRSLEGPLIVAFIKIRFVKINIKWKILINILSN